jgi:hypothetical protein
VRVILLIIRSVKKIFNFPERAAVSASIPPGDGVLGQLLRESAAGPDQTQSFDR